MQRIVINNIADIDFAAAKLLKGFEGQMVFAFFGEMGAGKTTFIQALCRKLDVIEVVNSPTFTIVNEYHTENSNSIYHFDFFRIKKIEEVYYSGNYCFIEWPELITDILPDNAVLVKINVDKGGTNVDKGGTRILEIE